MTEQVNNKPSFFNIPTCIALFAGVSAIAIPLLCMIGGAGFSASDWQFGASIASASLGGVVLVVTWIIRSILITPATEAEEIEDDGSTTGVKPTLVFAAVDENGKLDQDRHFYGKIQHGYLVGVADGHGPNGEKIAEAVVTEFPKLFEEEISRYTTIDQASIKRASTTVFAKIHTMVCGKFSFHGGSTATFSFVPKGTNQVFTMALGDSPAHIVNTNGFTSLVPDMDWNTDTEKARAEAAGATILSKGHLKPRAGFQYGDYFCSVNVTRGVGDRMYGALMSHEPIVTEQFIKKGDLLVVESDSLRETFLGDPRQEAYYERWMINNCCGDPLDFADTSTKFAIRNRSRDNTTTVAVLFE